MPGQQPEEQAVEPQPDAHQDVARRGVVQIRDDDARVDGQASEGGVSCGELAREEYVGQFGLAVALGGEFLLQLGLLEDDAARGRHPVAHAGDVDDADVAVSFLLLLLVRRLQQCREQQLGQERMPHMVRPELQLVPFLGEAVRCHHHARVVDQDIETGLAREKGRCGGGDGREGREVQGEVLDRGGGGIGEGGLELLDRGLGFGFAARGEVDARGGMRG